ncbi:MAG: hypothetical protein U0694_08035 [Anaerolineae bacterium]
MKYLKFFLLMTLMLLFAACRGTATEYPPTIPPRETTPVPTLDPSLPTATLDPTMIAQTPSGIESGGGTYTSRDGRLSFVYPQGWLVQETGGEIVIVNNSAAFNSVPRSGQYQISLIVSPIGEIAVGSNDTVQASISAQEALVQLAQQYQTTGTEVSDPVEDSLGGRPTYFVRINSSAYEALLGVLDINGTHIALAAAASRGELSLLEPIARTIGASIEYAS